MARFIPRGYTIVVRGIRSRREYFSSPDLIRRSRSFLETIKEEGWCGGGRENRANFPSSFPILLRLLRGGGGGGGLRPTQLARVAEDGTLLLYAAPSREHVGREEFPLLLICLVAPYQFPNTTTATDRKGRRPCLK